MNLKFEKNTKIQKTPKIPNPKSLEESVLDPKTSRKGWTSLINAAREGHADCVEVLLKAGANVEATNNNGSGLGGRERQVLQSERIPEFVETSMVYISC